jgi:hypothetical protein
MLLRDTYQAIQKEIVLITEQARALEEYFRQERKIDRDTGQTRDEWSRYIFRVIVRQGRRPILGWHSITPIPMGNGRGGKKVVPRERYLKIGGRGATEYPSATFRGAKAWEQALIWEIEEQATHLRKRLNQLGAVKDAVDRYLADTKAHNPAMRKFTRESIKEKRRRKTRTKVG